MAGSDGLTLLLPPVPYKPKSVSVPVDSKRARIAGKTERPGPEREQLWSGSEGLLPAQDDTPFHAELRSIQILVNWTADFQGEAVTLQPALADVCIDAAGDAAIDNM